MPKYSAKQFIKAIPGTGGIISDIADKVGCNWITAKKYVTEFPTVKIVYDEELSRVNDKAKNNIIRAINKNDIQTSKWWLQVKDKEFMPKEGRELTGKDGAPLITVNWDDTNTN